MSITTTATTPGPFVRRRLEDTEERISPVLETPAIREMQHMLGELFFRQRRAGVKPIAITCFDTSGSGKTATVGEAARLADASRIVLSALYSPTLTEALESCRRHPFQQSPGGLVQRREVEDTFQDKFHAALASMLVWIKDLMSRTTKDEAVDAHVGRAKYKSPLRSLVDATKAARQKCEDAFEALKTSLGKDRKLVLHMDDCQYFLGDVLPSPAHHQDAIPAGEVMALALRAFSDCIVPFAMHPNIVWVFTGTRPTLREDIILTSGLQAADISRHMTDFGGAEVYALLGHFFRLEDATPAEAAQLTGLCAQLTGPPKNVQFFLQAASQFHSLTSPAALIQQWEAIEAGAASRFHGLLESAYQVRDLDLTARNLALLHTTELLASSYPGGPGQVVVPSISRHLIYLVEAGLLRAHRVVEGTGWKVFPPNRLLIRLLRQHVRWYTWENIKLLCEVIRSSPVSPLLSGKALELLFALELCDWAQGKLWTFLRDQVGLRPLLAAQKPSVHLWKDNEPCLVPSHIHVMSDADLKGDSKWDVQFFAIDIATERPVRVLAQLILQDCRISKMTEFFDEMLALPAVRMDGGGGGAAGPPPLLRPQVQGGVGGHGCLQGLRWQALPRLHQECQGARGL